MVYWRSMTGNPEQQIGGNYTAAQNPDGTWDIFDVPIMGFVPAGERHNETDIGAAWMSAAVKTAAHRLREQYLGPFHIQHHDFGVTPKRAGFFLPVRVGAVQYQGNLIDAVFATLKSIPPRVFDRIDAGEIPYLSVEVHDWDIAEINSLAALETEVPYFRFPLLTIGKKVPAQAAVLKATRIEGRAAYFREKEGVMPKTVDPKNLSATDPDYEKAGGDGYFANPPEEEVATDEPEAKLEGTECDRYEGTMQEEPEGFNKEDGDNLQVEPVVEAPPAWATEMMGKMDQLLGLLGSNAEMSPDDSQEQSAPVTEPTTPYDDVPNGPDPEAEERPPMLKAEKQEAENAAKLHATNAKLTAENEKKGAKLALVRKVTKAAKALRAEGRHVSPELRADIKRFAAKGDHALDVFLAAVRKHVPKDPPRTLRDLERETPVDGDLPSEVMAYSKYGPDVAAAAKEAAVQFRDLTDRGHINMSLAGFLEANVKVPGN